MVQTIGRRPPTHHPPHTRCLYSSTSLRWPPTIGNHKTEATYGQPPSHHSIFWGVEFVGPNEEPNSSKRNPDSTRLIRTIGYHREPRHHDLGPPLPYPGRERAKPLEGRTAADHVSCCVFFVLCVVLDYVNIVIFFSFFSYPTCRNQCGQRTNKQTLRHCKLKATTKTPRYY